MFALSCTQQKQAYERVLGTAEGLSKGSSGSAFQVSLMRIRRLPPLANSMMRHTFALSCTQQKLSGQQAQRSVQSMPGLQPPQQAQQQQQARERVLWTAEDS